MDKLTFDGIEYVFFRNNPDLKNIVHLVVSGSRGYGTDNSDSDIDLRGFLVEDKRYLLGTGRFEQFEDIPTDTVIYGVKKFFSLCAAANPNALELLGADEDCIVVMSEAGRKVRENADMFLSKRVVGSFGNYASAQLRRLSNALCHDQFDAELQEKHLRDTLAAEIDHFNRTYTAFDKNAIRLYLDESETHGILADIHLESYPLRDFTGIYSEMRETIKSYDKLNHRNRKKDDAHLRKHAMHLIRLLIMGTDILNGRGIVTRRVAEHDFLMDIRNGRYSYPEIFALAEEYQAKFDEAAKSSKLPPEPDYNQIEKAQIEIFERFM
ncbi:nucleotidyltransferase [Clostridia bacterium]|nr:nucleotidyltransferase [Clostridia bacterium]